MDKKDVELRCIWCGWRRKMEDLDQVFTQLHIVYIGMDEKYEPFCCPECGHGQFDIKVSRKEKQK